MAANVASAGPSKDDSFYAQFEREPVNCSQLVIAYNGAMSNGDGMHAREWDANYVQNTFWYVKQRILRKFSKSAWAQPQYLAKVPEIVFHACQNGQAAASNGVDLTLVSKVVDDTVNMVSPYAQSDLVH